MRNITDEELISFIGKKGNYYLSKWKDFRKDGNTARMNIAALIFGLFWAAYRKMYLQAFILLGIAIAISVIEVEFEVSDSLSSASTFAFGIGVGLFGNYMYYRHAMSKISKLKSQFQDENMLKVKITEAGGTSLPGAIVFTVAAVAIIFLSVLIEEIIVGLIMSTTSWS